MNEGIELHDSKLAAVTCRDGEAIVSLSPAYLHRSAGTPGVDAGSGWLRSATLTISSAVLASAPETLPAAIFDGFLRIGSEQCGNIIPASGAFAAAIDLSLVLSTGETLTIRGQGISIQLLGASSFVESFNP